MTQAVKFSFLSASFFGVPILLERWSPGENFLVYGTISGGLVSSLVFLPKLRIGLKSYVTNLIAGLAGGIFFSGLVSLHKQITTSVKQRLVAEEEERRKDEIKWKIQIYCQQQIDESEKKKTKE